LGRGVAVAVGPVAPADLVRGHDVDELLGPGVIVPPVAGGIAHAPFRDEDGKLANVVRQHGGGVRARVEVKGVHDVGIAQLVVDDGDAQLGPVGRSHDDDGVRVNGPDAGDDVVGIGADDVPSDAIGLIADFIQHVGLAVVGIGHGGPEGPGFGYMVVGIAGIEDMPVDDAVHPPVGRLGDELVDLVGEPRRVGHVSILVHVHGDAEDIGAHGVGHVIQGLGGQAHVPSVPLDPMAAHAPQLNGVAAGIHQLVSDHLQFSIDRNRGGP
jgi:hypothetical protein